jgi:hypothetical protein
MELWMTAWTPVLPRLIGLRVSDLRAGRGLIAGAIVTGLGWQPRSRLERRCGPQPPLRHPQPKPGAYPLITLAITGQPDGDPADGRGAP